MSPPARGRKKKRRSRKWSASKSEVPAPPSKEEHGGKTGSSAVEVPPASDVQVTIDSILKSSEEIKGLVMVRLPSFN